MTYRPRRNCARCGVSRAAAGGLSRTGKCGPCGEEALAESLTQIAGKNGPVFERYRAGMTDYAARLWRGSVPPHPPDMAPTFDDLMEEGQWQDGVSVHLETPTTPAFTRTCSSASRSC